MPYRKKGNPHWYVRVPTRNSGSVQKSTHSTDKNSAKSIERLLAQIISGKKREFVDLVDAVREGRLTLVELLEADDANDLQALRAKLAPPLPAPPPEPSVTEQIVRWERWLADSVSPDTSSHYVAAVLTFVEAYADRHVETEDDGEKHEDADTEPDHAP
jgi:hypothetical protein